MNRIKVKHNDVKKVGTSCEDFSSGRVSVEEQHSPVRQSATVQKINDNTLKMSGGRGKLNKNWSKEERMVLWECYTRSILLGGRENRDYIK